jgi:hypothetical protein
VGFRNLEEKGRGSGIIITMLPLILDLDDVSFILHLIYKNDCDVISKLQGDNAVTALLTGPGIVFIQSLPFPRFSQRIAR